MWTGGLPRLMRLHYPGQQLTQPILWFYGGHISGRMENPVMIQC